MGFIDEDGKYHKESAEVGMFVLPMQSTYRQHSRDRQREDHRADLLQPYLRDGSPNPEFISVYPEESKAYGFIPKEDE